MEAFGCKYLIALKSDIRLSGARRHRIPNFSSSGVVVFVAEAIATTDPTIAAIPVPAAAICGARIVDANGWGCSRSGAKG